VASNLKKREGAPYCSEHFLQFDKEEGSPINKSNLLLATGPEKGINFSKGEYIRELMEEVTYMGGKENIRFRFF